MLSSISWQHYLSSIIILTVSYYVYVILRFYQTEMAILFNRKQNTANLFLNVQMDPVNVMGAAKLDNGVAVSTSEELYFADSLPDQEEQLLSGGEAPDAIEETAYFPEKELEAEAENLIAAFEGVDNKPEFITLLKILISSYERFKDQIDLPCTLNRIAEGAKEKLLFPLSLTDLPETWA